MKPFVHFLSVAVLCVACLLGGCGDNPRATALLSRADSLMASRPDSALQLLDSCEAEATVWPESQQMHHRLLQAKARNKAYVPFTSDSVMTVVADYYDRNGTANEQMEAHYLLGCVYRDLGEAPQALAAYHDAVECADTTAADCDYALLSRVHAQMASLLIRIQLPYETLDEAHNAEKTGVRAGDSLMILDGKMQKAYAYFLIGNLDSVISISEFVSKKYLQYGDTLYSLIALKSVTIGYIKKEMLEPARTAMDAYERLLTDKPNNIVAYSKKNFNLIKAQYYLKCHQYDSAYHYNQLANSLAVTPEERLNVLRGFSHYYISIGEADSALKYTDLYVSTDDSIYRTSVRENFAKTKALYDYTRYEKDAQQSKLHAIRAQLRFVITAVIALLILILAMLIAYRYREVQKKRQEEKLHYQQLLDSHGRTEKELSELRAHQGEQTLKELITQKEQELARLDAELAHYRRKSELMTEASSDEERLLRAFPFYQNLLYTTDQGHSLTANDWKTIRKFLQEHLPQFYRYMSDNCRDLTNYEYQVCLLVRLHLKPKSIANALGVDGSYVTRVRRSMVKKLFGVDVSSKEADMLVLQIDRLKATEAAD